MDNPFNTGINRLVIITASLLLLIVLAAGFLHLKKDTSLDAFIPTDSAALVIREEVTERFGLTEPIVIALIGDMPGSALEPDVLAAVRSLTRFLERLDGVATEQVISLATQPWVEASEDELTVRRLLPDDIDTRAAANEIRRGLAAAPGYRGTLVSNDLSATLIAVELLPEAIASEVYADIRRHLAQFALPDNVRAHIAGQATISGYLSDYIDRDVRVLVPLSFVLILLLLAVLLQSPVAPLLGLMIMVGTLVGTFGLMGWLDARVYVITSSLPALLLCISVADTIHLVARIHREQAAGLDIRLAVAAAVRHVRMPVTLTSLTTACGFIGIAVGSDLPVMKQYGLFAAFGVALAWALTLLTAPALYLSLPRRLTESNRNAPPRLLEIGFTLSDRVARHPVAAFTTAVLLAVTGLWGLSKLEFNEERVRNFAPSSPVFTANTAINQHFAGTFYLDVYLQEAHGKGLLDLETLHAIAGLQDWMENNAAGFGATRSYVDLIADAHRAATPDAPSELPATRELAAQLLLLYEIAGRTTDLNRTISFERDAAYLRGYLRSDNYQSVAPLIEDLQAEIDRRLTGLGLVARITGPVQVTHSWVGPLLPNTVTGIAVAVLLVGLASILVFRSLHFGLLCLLPVSMAVLFVFGLMGWLGIWLSVGTSMFAAISIGLGVDFGIHTLHAIRRASDQGWHGVPLAQVALRDVGGPLTINAVTLTVGLSVVLFSAIPPVGQFGLLTATAVLAAFFASVLLLPALHTLASRPTLREPAQNPASGSNQIHPNRQREHRDGTAIL